MSELPATSMEFPAQSTRKSSYTGSAGTLKIVTDNHVLVKSQVENTSDGWQECLNRLRLHLSDQVLESWFFPLKPVFHIENMLFLQVSSAFVAEWLEEHHGDLLEQVVKQVFGTETTIEFLVDSESVDAELPQPLKEPDPPLAPPGIPSDKPSEVYGDLNHSFCLEGYISSSQNNFAYKAVCHISRNPDLCDYNPLVIYGGTGAGKSHLVHGLANQVRKSRPDIRIGVIDAQKFLHDYIEALQESKLTRYNALLTSRDLLIVEDIQILSNKTKSQEGLLYILSRLVNKGAQVVLTSNVAPGHLHKFNPRLVSLFQTGLSVDLPPSDVAVRETLIRRQLREHHIFLEEETIRFLADTLGDNLHQLQAILTRIVAQISLTGRGVSLRDVKRIVEDFYPQGMEMYSALPQRRSLEIDDIIRSVGEYFDVQPAMIKGISRKKRIAHARKIAVFLCRELTNESLSAIGSYFSNLHHSTVIYSCKKIEELLPDNPKLRQAVNDLKTLLLS